MEFSSWLFSKLSTETSEKLSCKFYTLQVLISFGIKSCYFVVQSNCQAWIWRFWNWNENLRHQKFIKHHLVWWVFEGPAKKLQEFILRSLPWLSTTIRNLSVFKLWTGLATHNVITLLSSQGSIKKRPTIKFSCLLFLIAEEKTFKPATKI